MNYDIQHLYHVELSPPLCYHLSEILSAYRPFPPLYIRDASERIDDESTFSLSQLIATKHSLGDSEKLRINEAKMRYLKKHFPTHRSYHDECLAL